VDTEAFSAGLAARSTRMPKALNELTMAGGRTNKADWVWLSAAPPLPVSEKTNPAPSMINKRLIHPSDRR